jgi:hypothetical protein
MTKKFHLPKSSCENVLKIKMYVKSPQKKLSITRGQPTEQNE